MPPRPAANEIDQVSVSTRTDRSINQARKLRSRKFRFDDDPQCMSTANGVARAIYQSVSNA